ncbi:methyl-accepting chemotaxis protein [Rhizobium sp. P32RR-XVIII]|uniref:methyl-accepting chemotaxis protein n=1 Tax=Rhizobium sp. P32RR-XVIII TaxID=2726738 RepID=UPI002484C57C|nr:methyl-accepting chemotaxis protein [Rhizobium sp. P32RR-XVIII]
MSEINNAVNSIDQGTQQNAAMVEQSTAARHTLAREAAGLKALLARFSIDRSKPPTEAARSERRQTVESDVREMRGKIVYAFGGAAAPAATSWEEFETVGSLRAQQPLHRLAP